MKNILSIMCLFALLASSCSEDELVRNQSSNSLKFTASFEEGESRTYVEEGNLLRWTEGDQIALFVGNTLNRQYQFDGETGDNSGTFSIVNSPFGTGNDLNSHYAVYPYASDIKITESGVITTTFPAKQSYAENSFGLGANTMVAVTQDTDNTFLKFKNVGGYLKLQLYGDDVTVKSITLTGNNHEKLAGKATITSVYGQDPTITMATDATETITLDCGEGVKIGTTEETATAFWIVVPPTTFENGFEITVTDIYDGTFTKSTSNEIDIARNVIKPMNACEVIPKSQILYTYSGDYFQVPYVGEQAFLDAEGNVLSYTNEYADGKGVITFDGTLVTLGDNAFYGCTSLTSINIPESVTAILIETFYGCTALKSITIPDKVTHIGYYAFQRCSSLQNVIIGKSVKTIANYAFDWCESLQSITIPDSVRSIGMGAFRNCTSLKEVCCMAVEPPTLGNDYVFYNNATGLKFYVQITSLDAYEKAKYWSDYNIIGDYTPVECTSLTIEADDVEGYMTSTTIRYSAITNGLSFNRYNINNITITGEATSDRFDINTSLTESIERTISFSYLNKTATTTITQGPSLAKAYTVNLNNEWQNSSTPNPDPILYDGVYESFSNYHWNNHEATMYIDIVGYDNFTIYVRCDSEASSDYLRIYLDNKFIMNTKENGSSDTSFSGYTEVKFSGIDAGPHRIKIIYDKDKSDHSGADRGYIFIPKNQ